MQVDEPALREGLPLKADRQPAYLRWAVDAFRLATAAAPPEVQVRGGGPTAGGGGGSWTRPGCQRTAVLVRLSACVWQRCMPGGPAPAPLLADASLRGRSVCRW